MATVLTMPDMREIGARFQLFGTLLDARPYGTGHINDTFAVVYDQAGTRVRYIQQRLNAHVFRNPDALMDNVARVLTHAAHRLRGRSDAARRALVLVPATDGSPCARDDEGRVWRTYLFVEGARTYDIIEAPRQAEAAARAFAQFQHLLADLPGPRLHESIPGFHHTPGRLEACVRAIEADPHNRAAAARTAVDFVLARAGLVSRLTDAHARGDMPERITHNDTKLNNVMLDLETGEGLCVIDLDTTMPGLAPYDFGDMVRTATNSAAEDERDVARVHSRADMFDALAHGYLGAAGAFLTAAEIDALAFGGLLMTLECGIRFLADHLEGDRYFRTARPDHNLDRASVQFALVESMEQQMEAYERVIRGYARG